MNRGRNFYGNPWYRGYMPRSYIAPHRLASFGCSICLIVFGVFFLLAGTISTVMSKHVDSSFKSFNENPSFQDPFFKDSRERRKTENASITNVMRTIGVVLFCTGGIFIISAVGICCFAKYHMSKQERKRENITHAPLNVGYTQQAGYYPQPPPGSYPQQPAPPPGSYPQQPAPPPGSYPQQPASYPQQFAPAPDSYSQQPFMGQTAYQQSAPPATYPYPPTTAPPESYLNEKPPTYQPTSTSNYGSQMANDNPPPVGFKEG